MTHIGTIKEARGLKGDILVSDVLTGLKKIKSGSEILIGYSEQFAKKYIVESFRIANKKYLIKLKAIDVPEKANELKDLGIFANENSLEFSDELYLVDDLIGCSVFDVKTKELLGELKDVMILPGNDVWTITLPDGELPIPVIKDVVKKVNIADKHIEIELIPGLMDIISSNKAEKDGFGYDEN